MRYAYIVGGKVHCFVETPLEGVYNPDFIAKCVPCSDASVRENWVWNGTSFSVPVEPIQPTPADQAAAIRAQRDALLTACDWTQLPDSPLPAATKTAWAAYRQDLRDITAQVGFPGSVTWPVAPGA